MRESTNRRLQAHVFGNGNRRVLSLHSSVPVLCRSERDGHDAGRLLYLKAVRTVRAGLSRAPRGVGRSRGELNVCTRKGGRIAAVSDAPPDKRARAARSGGRESAGAKETQSAFSLG